MKTNLQWAGVFLLPLALVLWGVGMAASAVTGDPRWSQLGGMVGRLCFIGLIGVGAALAFKMLKAPETQEEEQRVIQRHEEMEARNRFLGPPK